MKINIIFYFSSLAHQLQTTNQLLYASRTTVANHRPTVVHQSHTTHTPLKHHSPTMFIPHTHTMCTPCAHHMHTKRRPVAPKSLKNIIFLIYFLKHCKNSFLKTKLIGFQRNVFLPECQLLGVCQEHKNFLSVTKKERDECLTVECKFCWMQF